MLSLDYCGAGDRKVILEILTGMCYLDRPAGHDKVLKGSPHVAVAPDRLGGGGRWPLTTRALGTPFPGGRALPLALQHSTGTRPEGKKNDAS